MLERTARRTGVLAVVAALLALPACETEPKSSVDRVAGGDAPDVAQAPEIRSLELVSHVGGTHYRTMVHRGKWLQTFSNTLLILDKARGTIESRRVLAEFGTTGPAVDFAAIDDRGLVVLERDAVLVVGVESGELAVQETVDWQALGLRPRRVSVTRGDFWVAGEGGVMRWSDRTRFLTSGVEEPLGTVVTAGVGPVACAGRRVYDVERGGFVGAASDLLELPPGQPAPLAFFLQGRDSAQVGLMGADIRELAAVTVPGTAHRLRWFDDRLWCVTDTALFSWRLENGPSGPQLVDQGRIRVKGARDVDQLAPNYLAVAGSFGRAIYRREREGQLPGDDFIGAVREASHLEKALSDGRRILAGSDAEGFWLYLIGSDAELTDRTMPRYKQPVQSVRALWGKAEIASGAKSVTCTIDGKESTYTPEGDPLLYGLALADDCLWVGHEYGLDVVGREPDGTLLRVGTLRLDGPVRYIEPKWDRGAAYVAEFGGFGVARVRSVRVVDGVPVDDKGAPLPGPAPAGSLPASAGRVDSPSRPGAGE